MTRILKYPLPVHGPTVLRGPLGLLSVGWQDDHPVLWAIAEYPPAERELGARTDLDLVELDVIFTGEAPPRYPAEILGTAQGDINGERIVCHVFRKVGP